ncbi:hypothetical protein C8R46DRAFT_35405 [Mycena filopes]|nr:hypothetical protein C8R46DRAFT_35405 [Mycena filopes]
MNLDKGASFIFAPEAFPDIWPRVWRWIRYLDKHHDALRHILPLSEVQSYASYSDAISNLRTHPETRKIIHETPGVREVMARAWATFLDNGCSAEDDNYRGVCRFLLGDVVSENNITELKEGAGGSLADLARLMVAHLKLFVPRADSTVSKETLTLLRPVVRLLKAINHGNDEWTSALFSQRIVPTMVVTIRSLTVGCSAERRDAVLDDCFIVLVRLLMYTPQHRHIAEAVKAGLLHAVVLSRTATIPIKALLTFVLPRSTVYYSVLRRIKIGLDEVDATTAGSAFRAFETFEFWQKFMKVATPNLEVFRRYEQGDWLSGRHCDNMTCGKRVKTSEAKQCSRCETSHYCSTECQASDWHEGGHRKVCARFRSLQLTDPEPLTARDRSFMWALAHFDYLTNKAHLYIQRMAVMNNLPGQLVFSVLDYASGAVFPTVRVSKALGDALPPSFQALRDESVARAARSGGRMHLVLLRMPEGHDLRHRLLTMHSTTSAINDGIEAIARSVPEGLDLEVEEQREKYLPSIETQIAALLKEDGCNAKLNLSSDV